MSLTEGHFQNVCDEQAQVRLGHSFHINNAFSSHASRVFN